MKKINKAKRAALLAALEKMRLAGIDPKAFKPKRGQKK